MLVNVRGDIDQYRELPVYRRPTLLENKDTINEVKHRSLTDNFSDKEEDDKLLFVWLLF